MIIANANLLALLASGGFCVVDLWQFALKNGTVLYLTGGQRSLTYGGHTYAGGVTITRSSIRQALGFEVSTLKVEMASESYLIGVMTLPQAVANGVFSGAVVTLSRAYCSEFSSTPVQVIPRFMGDIAGQEPGAKSVSLEFKSLLGRFGVQYPPTTFQPICNNSCYDTNCGLSKAAYTETLTVLAGSTSDTLLCAPAQAIENYYSLGVVTFTTGALAGQSQGVRGNAADGTISLLQPFSGAPATGDTFTVYPGCNRTKGECSTKFANTAQYRGYNSVPRAESIL